MAIQCVKLTTGEEIIGEVNENRNDAVIKIKDAASIHMVPSQSGQVNIAMLPWLPYSNDTTFMIAKENIMVMPFEPSTELLNRYNQMFGSGIQIANKLPPK